MKKIKYLVLRTFDGDLELTRIESEDESEFYYNDNELLEKGFEKTEYEFKNSSTFVYKKEGTNVRFSINVYYEREGK